MSKRIKSIVIALSTVLLINGSVLASPNTSGNPTQDQNVNNSINSQIVDLETSIEKLDSQIEQTIKNIDDNKIAIAKTESDVKNLQEQVKYTENDIKNHKDVLNKRARAFYMSGIDGYMDIIMESKDFSDLISRVDSIKRVMNFDEEIINNLKEKKQSIVTKKEKLQEDNKKLLVLKSDNETKLAKLNVDKENQKNLIEKLQIQQKIMATASIDGSNSPLGDLTIDSLPSKNNDVIAYSYKFLGTKYVWGGTTPEGFDCSGFMQYVYAHFGVSIGRTTYEQIKDGTEVPVNQLQPGDLVFFGTKEDPHHVGMYIGEGRYIHAPRTGDVIKISLLTNRNDYLTARRVK